MSFFYDTGIVEVLDLWYAPKLGKYGVRCLLEENMEQVLWFSSPQFRQFRSQCRVASGDGIYARYDDFRFTGTVYGARIPDADYRLVLCFDCRQQVLRRPVPPVLEVPTEVRADESLLDSY